MEDEVEKMSGRTGRAGTLNKRQENATERLEVTDEWEASDWSNKGIIFGNLINRQTSRPLHLGPVKKFTLGGKVGGNNVYLVSDSQPRLLSPWKKLGRDGHVNRPDVLGKPLSQAIKEL